MVVGYSKLMGADQSATLLALRKLRSELFTPCVARHGGETVKSMGDGWIVTFASISDAVKCAIDIQTGAPTTSSLELRVGIHLGDIVQEDEDLFGDGVNIASRLEAAATPGNILISDVVYHSLDGRLAAAFHATPPLKLKNIERAFAAYCWGEGPGDQETETGNEDASARPAKAEKPEKGEEISLGFLGMTLKSGDADSEMLCEGVDEAVRRAIANQTGMSLLADPEQADMLVEGSMQVRGDRYRTVVSLKTRKDQKLITSERFDGVIADLFEAEDDLALRICTALRFAAFRHEATSMDKSDLPIEEQDSGAIRVHAGGLLSDLSYPEWVEARSLLERVLARDGDDASALAMAGMACTIEPNCGWRSSDTGRTQTGDRLSEQGRSSQSGQRFRSDDVDLCLSGARGKSYAGAVYCRTIDEDFSALCPGSDGQRRNIDMQRAGGGGHQSGVESDRTAARPASVSPIMRFTSCLAWRCRSVIRRVLDWGPNGGAQHPKCSTKSAADGKFCCSSAKSRPCAGVCRPAASMPPRLHARRNAAVATETTG